MYRSFLKPVFDKLFAVGVILLTSPLMIAAIVALAAVNRGSVWFLQERPGLDGVLFRVIKFKTMNDKRDREGKLLPDGERLTWVGRIVRKISLDEIPQLFNVLKGEMSIVGPRPLLVEYLPLYSEVQQRRHMVKPGITGWAQVHGRNTVDWPRRFQYDLWYVDHQSFWLDLKIIAMTAVKVVKAEGISSSTSETMEKFRGNK